MKYEREQLEQISIHSLRNIARDVGVKSPTNLKKDILINEILLIQSGKKQPHTPSKRGRPIKTYVKNIGFENDDEIINSLSIEVEDKIKRKVIKSILKEVERKLNKIL